MAARCERNGDGGRDEGGRFVRGNRWQSRATEAARESGQRAANKRNLVRIMLAESANSTNIRLVVRQLWKAAERGERWAIVEILNRFVGRPGPDGTPKIDRQTVGSAGDQAKYVASLALDQQRQLDRFVASADAVLRGDDEIDEIQAAIDGRSDGRSNGDGDGTHGEPTM